MKSYVADQKLIRPMNAMYKKAKSAVLANRLLSEWFQMTVGNRQMDL